MSEVIEPVGTIDPANADLIDPDALLVDTGDDELYVIRIPEVEEGGE